MWVCKNWGLIYLADQDKGFIILGDHYSDLTSSSKDLLGLG
jgi:hypothetical protein